VQREHPDLIFLSESFTRPNRMKSLGKLGFTQSYTYFTWKNSSWELRDYMTELTKTDMVEYYRPNFFANTPDILHEYLQHGGRPAFRIRLILAVPRCFSERRPNVRSAGEQLEYDTEW
jgi:starch synthase (maltosyl-transferring)